MAYQLRTFWQTPEERQAALAPVSSPSAPAATATPTATASAPVAGNESGAPGAIRAFFAANQDQGANVLGGLANSLNQRIASENQRLTADRPVAPDWQARVPALGSYTSSAAQGRAMADRQPAIDAINAEREKFIQQGKEWAAKAGTQIQPLGEDVGLLNRGQEGYQTLLERQNQGAPGGYTPGQSRLDAWLAGGALNANPSAVVGAGQNWAGLRQAATAPSAGLPAMNVAGAPPRGPAPSPPREHNTGAPPTGPVVPPGAPGGYGQPGYNPRNGTPKPSDPRRRTSPR